jgi:hypothetical protein
MAHPAVAMAACIAARHPKWDERPLLVVMKKPGAEVTREELLAFYDGKIAKWWTPDDVVFVDAIPLGRHRQDAEDQAARAVQGPRAAHRLTAAMALRTDATTAYWQELLQQAPDDVQPVPRWWSGCRRWA